MITLTRIMDIAHTQWSSYRKVALEEGSTRASYVKIYRRVIVYKKTFDNHVEL